jgi:hypothetical protein
MEMLFLDKVAVFHVGKGGKFNNGGHTTFLGIMNYNEIYHTIFNTEKDLYEQEDGTYLDHNGKEVCEGIGEDGIFYLNEDGIYDTTYSKHIKDLQDVEIEIIRETYNVDEELLELINELYE